MCERCGGEAHAHMHNRLPPVTGNPLQRHATPLKHPLKRGRAPLLTCVLYCRRHSVPCAPRRCERGIVLLAPPAAPPRPETAALDLTGRVTSGDNTRTDNKVARRRVRDVESTVPPSPPKARRQRARTRRREHCGHRWAICSRKPLERKPWPRYRDRMEDGAR